MTPQRIALAALAAASFAAPIAAQGTCEIETRKPFQLTSAILYIAKHDQSAIQGDRLKLVKQAVKVLTDNPDRIRNEVGRNYLLGQLYVRWFQDMSPQIALRAKRGDVGFGDNPEGEFFLPTALNEAMGVVERDRPACADSTARYRNAVFAAVLNASINFYNAKSYDSAITYANYALQVNAHAPQVGAANQVLSNSSFNLAVLTRDQALKQGGDARSAGLRRAAQLFQGYLDIAPSGENASTARAAYARALQDAGDTASVAGIYADMMANPGKYTAIQLFEAGVVQANGKKFEDAAKLYAAGLQMNPWHRDALFNTANVFMALHQPDQMSGVVERLRAVDPMNPDVLKLAGAVWQERGKLTTDASVKKMCQDSVIAYVDRSAKLPARVTVTQFVVARDNQVTLAGSVENLGTAPASFTVQFELLDKTGAPLGVVEVKAEQVAAKGAHAFSSNISVAGVVAWRYSMR